MEQFRAFLEILKKYHFWILCGLILLLSLVSWYLATAEQENQFLARKKAIESKLSLDRTVSGNPKHPNENYNKAIQARENGPLRSQVANASERLYNEQRASNPLPEVYANPAEQQQFEAAFDKIWRPMEDIASLPPEQQMPPAFRQQYSYHIADEFPKLFNLIERRTADPAAGNNTNPAPQLGIGGGGRNPVQQAAKMVGIVDWDDAEKKSKLFSDRFAGSTPSTLDIMMAQEDLWVYKTLLKVIRNTNDTGSDPKHLKYERPASHKVARIKQILAMDIGKDAVDSWVRSDKSLFNLPNEAGGGAPGPSHVASPPGGGMPGLHGTLNSGGNSGASPLAGRYVDDNGKPLSDPTHQPYEEFRMMPINLQVVIEQREIPRLLAECANSAMRIDVRGVRILVEKPPPSDLTPTAGAASSNPSPSPGGMGGTQPGMHGGAGFPGAHGGMAGNPMAGHGEFAYEEESVDPVFKPVPVEVQGIIYIYNPPSLAQDLKTGASAAAGGNGGQAAPAPPGGGPVAPPAAMPAAPARSGGPAPAAPAASGVPVNPITNPPRPGGR